MKSSINSDKLGSGEKIDEANKKIPDTSWVNKKQIIMLRSLRLKVKYLVSLAFVLLLLLNTVENKIANVSDLTNKKQT